MPPALCATFLSVYEIQIQRKVPAHLRLAAHDNLSSPESSGLSNYPPLPKEATALTVSFHG
jgi:hypothetical protein